MNRRARPHEASAEDLESAALRSSDAPTQWWPLATRRRRLPPGGRRLVVALAIVSLVVLWIKIDHHRQRAHKEYMAKLQEEQARKAREEEEAAKRQAEEAKRVAECEAYRDYGLVGELQRSPQAFCQRNSSSSPTSMFTYYHSDAGVITSTVFNDLWVDLRQAEVFKPIANVSQDGHLHDPRFLDSSLRVHCKCATEQDSFHGLPRLWHEVLALYPQENHTVCERTTQEQVDALASGWQALDPGAVGDGIADTAYPVTRIKTNAIVLARRDDHNPFFQISAALNAWLMLKVVGWRPEKTQLVYFDDGFPSHIDALQKAVMSPNHPVIFGKDVLQGVVHFDRVMIAPFEMTGPMMRHLNDDEPCRRNKMISDFRAFALKTFNVSPVKADPSTCLVTIITRKPYDGRIVQRKWLNEDEVLGNMTLEYAHPGVYNHSVCRFQSVDFVHLSLVDQMRLMVESDVVIGMHGAGMVNVLWTRPETLVVEIFPRERYRWGYRNLCQFVGCEWHEFRGGNDSTTDLIHNVDDKTIPYREWHEFFDDHFRARLKNMETEHQTHTQQLRSVKAPGETKGPTLYVGHLVLGALAIAVGYAVIIVVVTRI
ncbi:hypothetical protein Poli38472_010847 [Pythium oligandrum]|uniref:Glycosyltransferase 61 catalytic domain-containing protein n=1 Tax=Pythium oligandrum TaxID=41045 RepID=A0A8K1FI75_PYTOL|nr:hypothetical protein Poli38472_010847 [Pythium oligandrum]|eukprot:TMW61784.1 hypothetical protein Poli38472_010847 [Pythium oligandrum]